MSKISFPAWIATFLVTIGLQITPCVAFGDWFGRKSAEPLEKVTVGARPGVMTAMVWVADAKGFFREEGLDVTIKEYPSGKRALNGVFDNEVDIATVSEVPVVFNSFDRDDFLVLATIGYTDDEMAIIARKDSGINTAADLTGKRIHAHKASSTHFFLSLFLMQNLIPESDVDIVYLPPDKWVSAIVNGEVDAISVRDPTLQRAKEGLGDNAVEFRSPGLYRKTFNLVALRDFIENRPETIEKVIRAVIKSEDFIGENPSETIEIIAQVSGLEREEVAAIWDNFDLRVSLDQSLLVSLADEARWAIKNRFTDKTKVPNYLDFIYLDGLEAVKPDAVTVIH